MTVSQASQILLGLPGTGKSTFLAALWYTAESRSTQWELDHLGENDEHLRMLSKTWLRCDAMERSSQAGEATVEMRFRNRRSNTTVTTYFPDLAGETFEDQWVNRSCPRSYLEVAQRSNQILLFIHPNKLRKGDRIEDFLQHVDEVSDGNAPTEGRSEARRPERDPTQVILVDLLQMLSMPPIGHESLRIAVIVSAWDSVESAQQQSGLQILDPDRWFTQEAPLLDQFLRSNRDWVAYRVFGVSAQGGDYGDQETVNNLRNIDPSDRVQVIKGSEKNSDLTAPMSWLAGF